MGENHFPPAGYLTEKSPERDISGDFCRSKNRGKTIQNAESAFKRFFKKQAGYPKFKKKGKDSIGLYFVKVSAKQIIKCERHRIKIPIYGFVRLKEKGYIPTNPNTHVIKSGTISYDARTLLCERSSGNSGRADCPC